MSALRCLALLFVPVVLGGCGLRVPEIQEVGDRVEGQRFVQEILTNIKCELRGALNDVRAAYPQGSFLDGFGIQTTLTLTLDEKGSLAPGVSWMPNSVFTLGAGVNLSSDAQRTETIDAYYLVSDLEYARCSERPDGPFLLQSDLKLSEWLFDALSAELTNTIDFKAAVAAFKDKVIQHEVKFIIDSGATATPSWTLTLVKVNQSGTFLSLDRTRTHDLLITFGPAVPGVVAERAKNGRAVAVVRRATPGQRAADVHLAALIASSIQSAVRNALH
jgi:hypothetical protein